MISGRKNTAGSSHKPAVMWCFTVGFPSPNHFLIFKLITSSEGTSLPVLTNPAVMRSAVMCKSGVVEASGLSRPMNCFTVGDDVVAIPHLVHLVHRPHIKLLMPLRHDAAWHMVPMPHIPMYCSNKATNLVCPSYFVPILPNASCMLFMDQMQDITMMVEVYY